MIEPPKNMPYAQPTPIVEEALEGKNSIVAERIYPKHGNFHVSSPDGMEVWYRVVTRNATPEDFQLMLDNRPVELGMVLRDENIEQWRESLKK